MNCFLLFLCCFLLCRLVAQIDKIYKEMIKPINLLEMYCGRLRKRCAKLAQTCSVSLQVCACFAQRLRKRCAKHAQACSETAAQNMRKTCANLAPLTVTLSGETKVGDLPAIANLDCEKLWMVLDFKKRELAQDLSLNGQVESGDVLTIQPANQSGVQKMSTAAPPKKMRLRRGTGNTFPQTKPNRVRRASAARNASTRTARCS